MEVKKMLHITNGDDLAENLQELDLPGNVIIWREMLCEGPTSLEVGEEDFLKVRKEFLNEQYSISEAEYQEKFVDELKRLATINNYDEVVLWFEFDLFSHMNLLALISFLVQNRKKEPLFLVCSKKLEGEKEMHPLAELSGEQLKEHFNHRISLTASDVSTATLIWELYCSRNPKRLTTEITKSTNFEYLSSSIRAHIERFPNAESGLNSLETQVLKLIQKHKIKSLHHLLGYALQYQGYYGYVDIQMQRVIEKLTQFYHLDDTGISLTDDGEKALARSQNYYQQLKDNERYGGVGKYEFLYEPDSHNLLKL